MNQKEKQSIGKGFPPAVYLCAGTLSLMVLGLIYGWSLFKAPLQQLFPTWTESNLSTGFTLLMGCYAIGGMISGYLSKLKKPRMVYLIMAVLMLAGFLGASTMDPADSAGSLTRLYLT